jgi:hypothetical protein
MVAHVEYLGFQSHKSTREYALRVRRVGDDDRDFTVVIANNAFLDNRVRYQDGPEICFWKLQRELSACDDGRLPARKLRVSDEELEAYRDAHTPKSRLHGLDAAAAKN